MTQAALPKPATVGPDCCGLSEGSDYESSTATDDAHAHGVTTMGGFDQIPDYTCNANLGGYDTAKYIKGAVEDLHPLAKFNATVTGIAHVRPSQ